MAEESIIGQFVILEVPDVDDDRPVYRPRGPAGRRLVCCQPGDALDGTHGRKRDEHSANSWRKSPAGKRKGSGAGLAGLSAIVVDSAGREHGGGGRQTSAQWDRDVNVSHDRHSGFCG